MIHLVAFLLMWQGFGPDGAKGVMGEWRAPTTAVLRVYACGKDVCVKLIKPSGDVTRKDAHNPMEGMRGRPLCGLELGSGFKRVDDDHANEGRLYDPNSGHTYKGTMTAEGDSLKLRGYIGIPLFGRTETWQRVPVGSVAECGK